MHHHDTPVYRHLHVAEALRQPVIQPLQLVRVGCAQEQSGHYVAVRERLRPTRSQQQGIEKMSQLKVLHGTKLGTAGQHFTL